MLHIKRVCGVVWCVCVCVSKGCGDHGATAVQVVAVVHRQWTTPAQLPCLAVAQHNTPSAKVCVVVEDQRGVGGRAVQQGMRGSLACTLLQQGVCGSLLTALQRRMARARHVVCVCVVVASLMGWVVLGKGCGVQWADLQAVP